jgi:hypothetical protein
LLVGRVTIPFAEEDLDTDVLYQNRMFIVSGKNAGLRNCQTVGFGKPPVGVES